MLKTKASFCHTMQEFKIFRDKHDPWGQSLSLLFDVAAELWARGDISAPLSWGYSPGACGDDPRDFDTYYAPLLTGETTADLVKMGHILSRYTTWLSDNGHSY